jgi:NADH-quinone oxidoreductase subunit J
MQDIFLNSEAILFWIIAGLTGGSAVMTLLAQNIVRSATWLLFTLGGTSGIFFLLGADFVGATQLLVYVGGTLILVVFGVMLTAQGPFITMKTSAAEWALSLTVGVALYATLAIAALNFGDLANRPVVQQYAPNRNLYEGTTEDQATTAKAAYTDTLGRGFLGHGVGPAHKEGDQVVRTSYLLPFEIVSVHLLVVLIGAAYLARAKRRRAGNAPANT